MEIALIALALWTIFGLLIYFLGLLDAALGLGTVGFVLVFALVLASARE